MFLKSHNERKTGQLATGPNIVGDVWIHESAKVDPTSTIGPNVCIGSNCEIGPGSKIYDSTILAKTVV